jgi:hypothetical protein
MLYNDAFFSFLVNISLFPPWKSLPAPAATGTALYIIAKHLITLVWRYSANEMDSRIRGTIEEHWRASEAGDIEAEHAMYAPDAILDYPQSGERFRGRATISAQRSGHPADRHFTVRKIAGGLNLWVSEVTITYDSVPSYSVSIMEFENEQVVHETQYFADAFDSPAWRAALAEPIPV